jgi:hypothetical protein
MSRVWAESGALFAARCVLVCSLGCAHAPSLEGAWRSLPDAGTGREEIVHLFRGSTAMVVFAGKCGPVSRVEIESVAGEKLTVQFYDDAGRATIRRRLVVEGDLMYQPVRTPTGQGREVFERTQVAVILNDHVCARALYDP